MLNSDLKKRTLHRAKIIRGQLDGLIKAIDQEIYCPKLLEQSLSIQRSMKSLNAFILENHLSTHVQYQMRRKGETDQAIKELIRIYNLANK